MLASLPTGIPAGSAAVEAEPVLFFNGRPRGSGSLFDAQQSGAEV
jgi:hypothetical protein